MRIEAAHGCKTADPPALLDGKGSMYGVGAYLRATL